MKIKYFISLVLVVLCSLSSLAADDLKSVGDAIQGLSQNQISSIYSYECRQWDIDNPKVRVNGHMNVTFLSFRGPNFTFKDSDSSGVKIQRERHVFKALRKKNQYRATIDGGDAIDGITAKMLKERELFKTLLSKKEDLMVINKMKANNEFPEFEVDNLSGSNTAEEYRKYKNELAKKIKGYKNKSSKEKSMESSDQNHADAINSYKEDQSNQKVSSGFFLAGSLSYSTPGESSIVAVQSLEKNSYNDRTYAYQSVLKKWNKHTSLVSFPKGIALQRFPAEGQIFEIHQDEGPYSGELTISEDQDGFMLSFDSYFHSPEFKGNYPDKFDGKLFFGVPNKSMITEKDLSGFTAVPRQIMTVLSCEKKIDKEFESQEATNTWLEKIGKKGGDSNYPFIGLAVVKELAQHIPGLKDDENSNSDGDLVYNSDILSLQENFLNLSYEQKELVMKTALQSLVGASLIAPAVLHIVRQQLYPSLFTRALVGGSRFARKIPLIGTALVASTSTALSANEALDYYFGVNNLSQYIESYNPSYGTADVEGLPKFIRQLSQELSR